MPKEVIKIVQSDKRGQIVIPQPIRNQLNLKEGSAFWIYNVGDGIYLKKVKAPSEKEIKKKINGAIK